MLQYQTTLISDIHLKNPCFSTDPVASAVTKPENPTSLIGPLLGAIFPAIAIVLAVYCLLQRRRQKVNKYNIGAHRHYDVST